MHKQGEPRREVTESELGLSDATRRQEGMVLIIFGTAEDQEIERGSEIGKVALLATQVGSGERRTPRK